MYIAGGQQLPLAGFQPADPGIALAPWAMPVAARVVGDGGRLSAAGTAITVSAAGGGAAAWRTFPCDTGTGTPPKAGMAKLADAADLKFQRRASSSRYVLVNNNLIDMISKRG